MGRVGHFVGTLENVKIMIQNKKKTKNKKKRNHKNNIVQQKT